MKHTTEIYDDIYLAELLHSEDKKPSPWYRVGLMVVGLGLLTLAVLAWTLGR